MSHRNHSLTLSVTLLAALSWTGVARADTLVLKDGSTLVGRVVDQQPGKVVVIATDVGTESIPWEDVKRVTVAPRSANESSGAVFASLPAPTFASNPTATKDETTSEAGSTPKRSTFFDVDLRSGVMLPTGSGMENYKLGDTVSSAVPLRLDLGIRFARHWYIGVYGSYAWASLVDGACSTSSGVQTCHVNDVRAGLETRVHLGPFRRLSPWFGLATGQEWMIEDVDHEGDYSLISHITSHGFAVELEAGLDVHLLDQLAIGPLLTYTLGRFTDQSFDLTAFGKTTSGSSSIDQQANHGWVWLGVRVTSLL